MIMKNAGTTTPSILAVLALVLGAFVAGCEDEEILPPVGLEEEDLVGTYEATSLVLTMEEGEGGDAAPTQFDALETGGSLTVTLRADGTASGTASFLGFDPIGEAETLHGGWEFDDVQNQVILEIPRISLLDGTALDVEQGAEIRLSAAGEVDENRFDVTAYDVVLTQQEATP